ncbi:E3 ubiquitin-protein ligase TRIM35-like [Sardina pilchardus]|uniref:E3 ubiquitin-protein ligase TRIM35-like n=1 Tax=Sardina pilchardus TaxID=27697 RepID=UPI002E10D9E6
MAACVLSLEEDLSCSVCCDVFQEPVLLSCGHSFCRKCLSFHWSSSPGRRRCPVCRRSSPQEPVPNISLRSTCESFLKQRREASEAQEEEEERGKLCPEHGQELVLFCETDQEPVCSQCKNSRHRGHHTMPVQRAVKERKGRLADATEPLRDRLGALRSGSADGHTSTAHIKAVVEKCEVQIRKDFDKLFKFLQEEQKDRLEAVRVAGIREIQLASEAIEAEATLLSSRVQEAEEMAQKDDITFLQEFDAVMMSTKLRPPEPARCPWAMIDVPRRLGNLRFNVWKKMKEVAPYYPVILDPDIPPVGIILSDDLTSVKATPISDTSSPLSKCYVLVMGSKALDDDCHVWDVHVGDSSDWMVGVTSQRHFHLGVPLSVSPFWGFWAIQRKNEEYFALTSPPTRLRLPFSADALQVLRVKLLYKMVAYEGSCKRFWEVTFSDARKSRGSTIYSFLLGGRKRPLYPFLCPLRRGGKLTLEPAEVTVEVKGVVGFWEKYGSEVILFGTVVIIVIIAIISLALRTDLFSSLIRWNAL